MPQLPELPAVPLASRRESIAQILRDAITSGRLHPGQKLTEVELSTQFGTSRAPVREAFRQLEQEGLVSSNPYRGTEVLGVSQEEIDNVLVPIRLILERFAFAKALEKIGDDDFAELDGIVDDMYAAVDAQDPARLADNDVRFHEKIVVRSEQQHCVQVWRSIKPRVRSYFLRDAAYYADPRIVARQHRDLIRVLRDGRHEKVDAEIVEHIGVHFTFPGQHTV